MAGLELEYLEELRLEELGEVLGDLPAGGRVLEIGAGSGFQARDLAARGFSVEALDLASSNYAASRVFSVRDYDGKTLPFPDQSFDALFSSNVLEHVLELPELLAEMQRVLRPRGVMVHVLPTASWRLWTTLSFYPLLAKYAVLRIAARVPATSSAPSSAASRHDLRRLLPRRHGERGNVWSELYLFSRHRWRRLFRSVGLRVAAERGSGLFYTGHVLFGARLRMPARRALSSLLGSSTRIWVLGPD